MATSGLHPARAGYSAGQQSQGSPRMPPIVRQPKLGRACLAAALAATVAALVLPVAAPAQDGPCPDASSAPGSIDDGALRRALRCVVNEERDRLGLRPLRGSTDLGDAARSHAADMVARGYFAHERPGWTLPGRLRAAGWNGSVAAEAIAWGCGGLGTPSAVLAGWLASPPHRAILLAAKFTRAGVGLAAGAPYATDCPGAGMWVLEVGAYARRASQENPRTASATPATDQIESTSSAGA
jgi:uncharacterized protein YkwD